jgi:hypothetical protein
LGELADGAAQQVGVGDDQVHGSDGDQAVAEQVVPTFRTLE